MCLTPQKLSNAIIPQKTALGHMLAPLNDPFSKKSYTYGWYDTDKALNPVEPPVAPTYSPGQLAAMQIQSTPKAPVVSPAIQTTTAAPALKLKAADPSNPYYGLRINSSSSGLSA